MNIHPLIVLVSLLSLPFIAILLARHYTKVMTVLAWLVPSRSTLLNLVLGSALMAFFMAMKHASSNRAVSERGDAYLLLVVVAFVLLNHRPASTSKRREFLRIGTGISIAVLFIKHAMVHLGGSPYPPDYDPYGPTFGDLVCVVLVFLLIPLFIPNAGEADVTERVEHLRGTVLKDYDSLRDHDAKNPPEN